MAASITDHVTKLRASQTGVLNMIVNVVEQEINMDVQPTSLQQWCDAVMST